jgi:hypothetical protein
MSTLDEVLETPDFPVPNIEAELELPEPIWQVDNDSKAAWAIRKLAGLRAHQEANKEIADVEIMKITEWRDNEDKHIDRQAAYFVSVLTQYALSERITKDRKSIKLPRGTISTSATAAKWTIDEKLFIPWAEKINSAFIRIKKEVALVAAKEGLIVLDDKVLDPATGELAPGVTVTQPAPSVSIKTN